MYVPASAAGESPVPLVTMLHGTSQDGQHFYHESTWRTVADAEGIVVVFPDALTYCFFEDTNHDRALSRSCPSRRPVEAWRSGAGSSREAHVRGRRGSPIAPRLRSRHGKHRSEVLRAVVRRGLLLERLGYFANAP